MNVLALLTLISFFLLIIQGIKMFRGLRMIPSLTKQAKGISKGPLLSVIISAKDEELKIKQTILSLFKQSYKNLELIIVNDRSEDHTAKIIEECKLIALSENITYKSIHIEKLPSGWAGKNHGLYQGYLVAKGDYLLFTDADISFKEDTLSKTMDFVVKHDIDHIAMLPYIISKDFALRSFTHLFLLYFTMFIEPWKVYFPGKKGRGVGVGAFNLIRKEAYEKLGTHREFSLHPVDDVELGKRVKKMNYKQYFVIGKELIEVEWYPNLGQAIKGFEKNSFGALNYSLIKLLGFIFLQYLLFVQPFVGFFTLQGWMLGIVVGSLIMLSIIYTIYIRTLSYGSTVFEFLFLPLTVVCYMYTLFRSAYLILTKKGIHWRGTFYSLKEIKELNVK